jgi:hypothetical protein
VVEHLPTGDRDGSSGHQTCADSCCYPASDQEESLPQLMHRRSLCIVIVTTT